MPNPNRIGQKYKAGDRIKKIPLSKSRSFAPRVGVILDVKINEDSRGYPRYYYQILWDDFKTPVIHAQHVLTPLNDLKTTCYCRGGNSLCTYNPSRHRGD